jgi:hypothetical protein
MKKIFFLLQTFQLIAIQSYKQQLPHDISSNSKEIRDKLFPQLKMSQNMSTSVQPGTRKLDSIPEGVDAALCVICAGLTYCSALNGLLVQEVYYPAPNAKLGTCNIIDTLGERMNNEIFGIGKTFRDSPQCRDIVMQYLCLFWGSENDMYVNLCYYKEDVSSPDPDLHQVAPRPPCRSFCVQVIYVLYHFI